MSLEVPNRSSEGCHCLYHLQGIAPTKTTPKTVTSHHPHDLCAAPLVLSRAVAAKDTFCLFFGCYFWDHWTLSESQSQIGVDLSFSWACCCFVGCECCYWNLLVMMAMHFAVAVFAFLVGFCWCFRYLKSCLLCSEVAVIVQKWHEIWKMIFVRPVMPTIVENPRSCSHRHHDPYCSREKGAISRDQTTKIDAYGFF